MRYGRSIVLAGLVMGLVGLAPLVGLVGRAQTIAQTAEPRKAEADRLLQQGIQQYEVSQFEAALQSWQQALVMYRELKDRRGEGQSLGNLGLAYQFLGNYAKAIQYHEQSLAIARELKNRRGEGAALGNLGLAYYSLGNYAKAIKYYEQYLAIAREIKNRLGEGNALGNLGLAYQSLGDYEKAIQYQEQSLAIAREIKDRRGKGVALGNLGLAYQFLGNYEKAIQYQEQSLAIAREIKDRLSEGASLGNLGNAYSLLGNYAKAIKYLEQTLAIAREIKDRWGEGVALSNLGVAYQFLGNYAKAIEYYEQHLAISREIKDREGEGLTLSNIGSTLKKQEQSDLAIVFYKQSVNVRESIRQDNRPLSRDLQASYTETVARTYRNLADLLLSQGRVLEAQQVLELLKIQELRDFTRDTRAGGKTNGSPLNPLEQPIPAAYNDKIDLGSRLTQCEQTKCAQRSQLIAQREEANQKFTALVDRLKKLLRNQEIKDPAQLQNDRFTLAAQKVILANPTTKTVLVYPLVLDDKLWLVWGSQAGKSGIVFDSKAIPVSRKDLSAKVGELQTLLSDRNSNPKQLQQVSQQLYQWLIDPIRKQLDDNGVKQIVFSLDRATRYIPMAALHDGKQYLVENFAISTILTAEIDTQDRLSANLQDDPVLGLGLTQAVPGFNALPAVKSEIDGIIRHTARPQDPNGIYPGLELFDLDFTETVLREKVADYRILHIATHGSFVPGNPEDSFLVLGNGKRLSIPSIKSMTSLANTHLVVLSACETGKGGVDKEGLEVAGIGHYFLLSGAKSVMASLWLVNDPATSLLMQQFYQNLATGKMTKTEALRQVQINFIKGKLTTQDTTDRAGGRRAIEGQLPIDSLAHPYYWAPFILIGNGL
ncbi:CHAT domain-containing protein [Phormidesmis sp. 146-12]